MEIMRVASNLVCTSRHEGLLKCSLRILKDRKGALHVAVDPVGTRPGDWVFTSTGTAARFACLDPTTFTDLAINGIIDFWDADRGQTGGQTEGQAEGREAKA